MVGGGLVFAVVIVAPEGGKWSYGFPFLLGYQKSCLTTRFEQHLELAMLFMIWNLNWPRPSGDCITVTVTREIYWNATTEVFNLINNDNINNDVIYAEFVKLQSSIHSQLMFIKQFD